MRILTVLLLICLPLSIFAGTKRAKLVDWNELNPQQQEVLSPFEQEWAGLQASRQRRLKQAANRWLVMTVTQRERARKQFINFKHKDPRRLAARLRRYDNLSEKQKATVHRQFLFFQSMPEQKKKELLEKWRKLNEEKTLNRSLSSKGKLDE